MKNVGIPASEVENTDGSGGVSAEGATAGVPFRGALFAPVPVPVLRRSRGPAALLARERLCACWTVTRGSSEGCAVEAGGLAGGGVGAGSTVSVGAVSVPVVLVDVLGALGGLDCALGEAPGADVSAPALEDSVDSASTPTPARSRPVDLVAGLTGSLNFRAGS
jgi:hypothetical protein